ncbi:hypothetical protein [Rhodopseudomonas palustris]|nr:hypothetical protein [Rhodopseudomonas palustris]
MGRASAAVTEAATDRPAAGGVRLLVAGAMAVAIGTVRPGTMR